MYEFEIWINNTFIADITALMQNVDYYITRNRPEELNFRLDIKQFETFCANGGIDPLVAYQEYVSDIRVKRNGVYKFGVQLVDSQFGMDESGEYVDAKCTGFLELFKDRYVTFSDVDIDASTIAWDLIDAAQSNSVDSFGVTKSSTNWYDTGKLRERNYVDQNVEDGIVNLTQLIDGNFDFAFTADRVFETYENIGALRTGFKLTYPFNIKSIRMPRTGSKLYNYIIGIGSGFGDEAIRSEVGDINSRLKYGTRQKIITYNSVEEQQTLDDNVNGDLKKYKDILRLPAITVSQSAIDLDLVWIGDIIPLDITTHPMINLDDFFRIEQIHVTLDENQAETIELSFDDNSV